MTTLVVSPHLDDAALSYGGHLVQLTSAGEDVHDYTVFTASPVPPYSPVATKFHDQWAIVGDPVAVRRDENDLALSILGVTKPYLSGGYLDSIYRKDSRGGWLVDDEDPTEHHSDEDELVASIAADVERLIGELAADRVVTCAALGSHVDHRRTRDAVLVAVGRTGSPLALWDDFPYVTWPEVDGMPPIPGNATASDPVARAVSDVDWETKLRAVACYASQIAMLESEGESIRDQYAGDCADRRGRFGMRGYFEVVRQVRTVTDAPGLRPAAR